MEKLEQLINATVEEAKKCMTEGKFEVKKDYDKCYSFSTEDVTIRECYGNKLIITFCKIVDCNEEVERFISTTKKDRLEKKLNDLKCEVTEVEKQLEELD